MNEFKARVRESLGRDLDRVDLETLQVNIGLKCNQTCIHCHLDAGPRRTELMKWPTMSGLLDFASEAGFSKVDITGGSPELNPLLPRFISSCRSRGYEVMVRTNLTVLLEEGMEDMPDFYRENDIELTASLPCYLEEEVREQRGQEVFEKSIQVLRLLNAMGYGDELPLNLVYNPLGAFLPPPQEKLQEDYREHLGEKYGISFTRLFTITNMPMGRFLDEIREKGQEEEYRELLRQSFNPRTLNSLMCRHQVNVGWDGRFYDCDFNQAIGLTMGCGLGDDPDIEELRSSEIRTGRHCFGCTAGSGSSCGGSLLE